MGQTNNPLRVCLTRHNLSIAHKQQLQKPISEHSQHHQIYAFQKCYSLTTYYVLLQLLNLVIIDLHYFLRMYNVMLI